jgi:phosphoglycerate dehydrogenase-like enzyme
LDDLFARADMVTVHAPSIPATKRIIGERQLRLLRDGATLVNTSRGSVIDEAALIAECRRREIYVALDVTDPEPPAKDSELRRLPNVYITPHVSGTGNYGYHRIGAWALQALRDHFAGQPVEGLVDFSRFAEIA